MANNGKICISLCATAPEELFAKIAEAERFADVIEVRFDCLEPSEVGKVLDTLPKIQRPYLLTYRPREQGGARELSIGTRIKFWSRALHKLRDHKFLADYEFDLQLPLGLESDRTIVSMHDFSPVGRAWLAGFDELWEMTGKTTKIAIASNTVTDAIPVWKLLETAPKKRKNLIPIGMGEGGKWTRILGLAHDAFMTYASLEAASETAPGQISAEDLIEVFRVKELDTETKVYGIVAGDTTYSISPSMHNAAFRATGTNNVFVPLQTADVGEFIRRMVKRETREVELNFCGFSVTNPHKVSIMQHLDDVDETAARIGAVNTVNIEDGKLLGYNTDAQGFIAPLRKKFRNLRGASVAVVGAGGASRAVIHSLQQERANVTLFARDVKKASQLADQFAVPLRELTADPSRLPADVLVNTTPLGTRGEYENATIATPQQLSGVKFVYDLVYNPPETQLIRDAEAAGVPTIGGLEMLIEQGAEQFRIWTGEEAPIDAMSAAVRRKLDL